MLYTIVGGDENKSYQYPAVTKFILSRDKVLSVEFSLTKLRSMWADSLFRMSKNFLREAMENFGAMMKEIVTMMGMDKDKVSFKIVDDDDKRDSSVLLELISLGQSVKLTFSDENLIVISEIFSITKGCMRDAISEELWTLFSLIIRKT